ncbi:MAG: hypothetical protein JNK82_26340 [Myxococcaceae bacterium]|nr:hypothetical protein [Myxococcaceae bacterium]
MATPALRARSELVFLADARPGEAGKAGHVVVRQGERVLDPVSGKSFSDLDAYLKENPHYRSAGVVHASAAARIFAAPPGTPARARAIADAKLAPGLGGLLVADSAPAAAPAYGVAEADRDASRLREAIEGGLTGWGTDEDVVWATLAGRTPADLALIFESYALHYGKSLRLDLEAEVKGAELERVTALLDGDGAAAAAAVIAGELADVFVDEALILDTLERASPAERRDIASAWAARAGLPAGQSAEEALLGELSSAFDDAELSRARALLAAGSDPGAAATHEAAARAGKLGAAMNGAGTDEAAIREVLEGRTPAELAALSTAFEAEFGVPLRMRLAEELGGGERDELLSLLDSSGDAVTTAARLYEAVSGAGTDEARVRELLVDRSPAELEAIAAAYERGYGEPLSERLGSELGGAERDVVLRLLDPGGGEVAAVAAAERLAAAVEGVGTDEAAIRAELEGRTKAELDLIAAAYQQKYGEPLRDRLVSELGGRDELELVEQAFDLGAVDRTSPGGLAEEVRRLRERLDLERGLGLSLTGFVQRRTKGSTDAERLEYQLGAAERAVDTELAARRLGFASADLTSLQSAKDSAAEGTAQGAAIAAGALATVATGGLGAPLWVVATTGALGGGAVGAGTYALLEGRAADGSDVAKQGLIGAVTGGTAALPLSGANLLKSLGLGARSGALAGAADGVVRAALEEDGTSVGELVLGGLSGAAAGVALGGVMGGAFRGLSAVNRAVRGAEPELAAGLSLAETRAVYPWGGRLPPDTRALFEVPGFADFARRSPGAAKLLSDAGMMFTAVPAGVREAAETLTDGAALEAAWSRLAAGYESMLTRITPHPTNKNYLVVERGPGSNAWVPEVALHPRGRLDHNGAFALQAVEDGKWVTLEAPGPTRFDPAQLIVGGEPLTSLDGVMVFSGHGAPVGFSGISTSRAAKLVADQIRAAAAAGREIDTVVLDACHQRDTRWLRGGSNSQAFRDFLNAELAKTGDGPVTVLAAERGGPTWGTMQRSWLPTGFANGRLTYTYDTARYVDAGIDTRLYVGPGLVAATAVVPAGTFAVLRYLYSEE